MALQIKSFISDPLFQSNSFIAYCDETGEGIIIDPGMVSSYIKLLEKEAVSLTAIVNTHGHLDHLIGVAESQNHFNIPFYIHEGDKFIVNKVNEYTAGYGLPPIDPPSIDNCLQDGERIVFGNQYVEVIHTPGHSPGSICLYTPGHLFTGDTIFARNIGRSDLDGGNHEQLIASIKTRILTLPGDTSIYPGHGPESTVADEMRANPWIQ